MYNCSEATRGTAIQNHSYIHARIFNLTNRPLPSSSFASSVQWVSLMEPSKYPILEGDIAFSQALESVRKDVECFFGVLKARFRILKLAMTYHKQERIDNVFFTCCILHNMLHTFDNMGKMEDNHSWVGSAGVRDSWQGEGTDSNSVGAKDRQVKRQVEAGHGLRKRQLTTSFMYRKKHKKDIVWLSR